MNGVIDPVADMRIQAIEAYMEKFNVSLKEATRAVEDLAWAMEDAAVGTVAYTNRAARRAQARKERKRNAHR